jgi:mRNA interferase RelE/StbE
MDSYVVEFAKRAEKDLRRIDTRYIPRIVEAAENLASDPRPPGAKKLVGSEHTYRIRVGDYRVIYEIEDTKLVVLVVRVRHRQGAYD